MLPIVVPAFCFSSQVRKSLLDPVIPVTNTCEKNLCVILKCEPLKSGGKGRGSWVSQGPEG